MMNSSSNTKPKSQTNVDKIIGNKSLSVYPHGLLWVCGAAEPPFFSIILWSGSISALGSLAPGDISLAYQIDNQEERKQVQVCTGTRDLGVLSNFSEGLQWPLHIPKSIGLLITITPTTTTHTPSTKGTRTAILGKKSCQDHEWKPLMIVFSLGLTFCTSVTYWATRNGENVVNSSARVAMWLYILSTRRAHSRTTGRSSMLPTDGKWSALEWQEHLSWPHRFTTNRNHCNLLLSPDSGFRLCLAYSAGKSKVKACLDTTVKTQYPGLCVSRGPVMTNFHCQPTAF